MRKMLDICLKHPKLRNMHLPTELLTKVLRAFAYNTLALHSNCKKVKRFGPIEATLAELRTTILQGVDEEKLPIGGRVSQLETKLQGGIGDFHMLGAVLRAFTNNCKHLRRMWTIVAMEDVATKTDHGVFVADCGSFQWESEDFKRDTCAALEHALVMITDAIQVGVDIDHDLQRAEEMRQGATLLLRAYDELVPSNGLSEELRSTQGALKNALVEPHSPALHSSWQGALRRCLVSFFATPEPIRTPPMDIAQTMRNVVRWAISMAHLAQVRVEPTAGRGRAGAGAGAGAGVPPPTERTARVAKDAGNSELLARFAAHNSGLRVPTGGLPMARQLRSLTPRPDGTSPEGIAATRLGPHGRGNAGSAAAAAAVAELADAASALGATTPRSSDEGRAALPLPPAFASPAPAAAAGDRATPRAAPSARVAKRMPVLYQTRSRGDASTSS